VYSLQVHVHIRHRRVYDEQKAVVVVQASLPGLRINAKRASARKYLRAVFLLVSVAFNVRFTTNGMRAKNNTHRFVV